MGIHESQPTSRLRKRHERLTIPCIPRIPPCPRRRTCPPEKRPQAQGTRSVGSVINTPSRGSEKTSPRIRGVSRVSPVPAPPEPSAKPRSPKPSVPCQAPGFIPGSSLNPLHPRPPLAPRNNQKIPPIKIHRNGVTAARTSCVESIIQPFTPAHHRNLPSHQKCTSKSSTPQRLFFTLLGLPLRAHLPPNPK
jgi:hypothetical protein